MLATAVTLALLRLLLLPLFAGIYRMGAGLGPATAFLYAGPAVNALAIILTARILGVAAAFADATHRDPDTDAVQHIEALAAGGGFDPEVVKCLQACHLDGSLYADVVL